MYNRYLTLGSNLRGNWTHIRCVLSAQRPRFISFALCPQTCTNSKREETTLRSMRVLAAEAEASMEAANQGGSFRPIISMLADESSQRVPAEKCEAAMLSGTAKEETNQLEYE